MFLFSHGLFQILTRGKSGLFPAFDVHSLKSCLSLIQQPLFVLNILQGTQQNRGVMVTPKTCKFLQLCEHQIGVQLTLLSCIFTPKWCKYDLHTILNAFKNTFAVLQQHWLGVYFLYLVFSNTKIGLTSTNFGVKIHQNYVSFTLFWCFCYTKKG